MNKTILFLQSEVHGYHIPLITDLVTEYGYKVKVIHWDKDNKTPYVPPVISGVEFIGKSKFNNINKLKEYVSTLDIALVRIAGWMDWDYVKVCKYLKRNKNTTTVVCSDTQWKKTLRQTLGVLIYGRFIRASFSHMMVAGPYQFEYARKLGFKKKQILFNNLSANSKQFSLNTSVKFEKTFLYVGRMSQEKGISILIDSWKSIKNKKGWKLHLVGSGDLRDNYSNSNDLQFSDYVPNDEIAPLMRHSGFFILPSNSESWGVVMHEAALSGLPIICSDQVGAIPMFLINGFNGYIFKSKNMIDLKDKINKVMSLNKNQLIEMRSNSKILGNRITTPISAASLVAALYE